MDLTYIDNMPILRLMIPQELKQWRQINGYSQARLARMLKVDVMTVSRWERGITQITTFLELALKALECQGGEKGKGDTKTEKEVQTNGDDLSKR